MFYIIIKEACLEEQISYSNYSRISNISERMFRSLYEHSRLFSFSESPTFSMSIFFLGPLRSRDRESRLYLQMTTDFCNMIDNYGKNVIFYYKTDDVLFYKVEATYFKRDTLYKKKRLTSNKENTIMFFQYLHRWNYRKPIINWQTEVNPYTIHHDFFRLPVT